MILVVAERAVSDGVLSARLEKELIELWVEASISSKTSHHKQEREERGENHAGCLDCDGHSRETRLVSSQHVMGGPVDAKWRSGAETYRLQSLSHSE